MRLRLRLPGRPLGEADAPAQREGALRIAPRAQRTPTGRREPRFVRALPLLGVALVAAGLALSLRSTGAGAGQTVMLVAARSLPVGTFLHAADLNTSGVAGGSAFLATLVPAAQERLVLGRRLAAPLERGEPLVRSALAAGRDPAAFTLTVGAEHALGGALRPGDRISVLATFQSASGATATRLLARGLVVLAVGRPPSIGDPSQATIPVTVALPDPALASRLALANAFAHIDLLRDGAAPAAPPPPGRSRGAAA